MKSYLRLSLIWVFALMPLIMGIASPDLSGGSGCGNGSNSPTPPSPPVVTLTSIAITPTTSEMSVNHTQQFTATGTYSDESSADITSSVTWTSSNTDIASISNTGLATALTEGSSTITATLNSITSNSAILNVQRVILTAAGQDNTGIQIPFLVESLNGGETWTLQSITGLPSSGVFRATSCTGSGSTALCIAAGQDLTGAQPALLAQSVDGGESWALQSVTNLPASGIFMATSCTGSGSSALCIAVGQDTGSNAPLLVESTNGGSTWALQSVTNLPTEGSLNSASCTGSGSSAVCIAVGQDGGSSAPLLVESSDGGNTWALQSVASLPTVGSFASASCTGSGSSAVCTAVGQDNVTGAPLLVVSTNGGNTWSTVDLSLLNGLFYATQCTGSGSTALCIAAGYNSNTGLPLLYESLNGGNTWNSVSITILSGELHGASCTGSGSEAVCVAVGQGYITLSPLIVESSDGGNTWSLVDLSLDDNGIFISAQCTGSGSSSICIAAGANYTTSAPLLYISTDSGKTWESPTITGFPTVGNLRGTGATK